MAETSTQQATGTTETTTPPPPPTEVPKPGSTDFSLSVKIPLPSDKKETLIAGKYKDQAAFETGIRELYKTRGIPLAEGRELIGEKGRWSSVDEAETEYKFLASHRLENGAENPLSDDDDLQGILKKAGIKAEDFTAKWSEGKKISDDHFAAIKKVAPSMTRKLAEETVASIYKAQQIEAEQLARIQMDVKNRAISIAGGEEQLNTLLNHFAPTLPPAIIQDLQRRLDDPQLAEGAVQELATRYQNKHGTNAVPIVLGSGIPSGPGPITNASELASVMEARRRGDKVAIARFNATPKSVLDTLQRQRI